MADISMCLNKDCPLAQKCYRFKAKASDNQSYMNFKPNPDGTCDDYMRLYSVKDEKSAKGE